MKKLRKLTMVVLLGVVVLVSISPAAARKVNEYEGQHRNIAAVQGR
ncbi:MAG: hypothetical protein K8J31_14345 [Anaerolineae bacterium]|nr:hypothetical protein [Anaerolineae bacterium]